jgi:hypothetical protein
MKGLGRFLDRQNANCGVGLSTVDFLHLALSAVRRKTNKKAQTL